MQSSLRENEGHSCRLKGAFKVEYSLDKREGTACRGPENDSMFITFPHTPPRSWERADEKILLSTHTRRFFITEKHPVFISAVLAFVAG